MKSSNKLVDLKFTDVSAQKLGEKPGPTILGYPTTHYRYTIGYTAAIEIFGFSRKTRIDSDLQLDCSKKLSDAGFMTWLRPARYLTGNGDFSKVINKTFGQLDCMVLRTKATTRRTGANGEAETQVRITTVTTLRQSEPPAGTFAIPADYERAPLIPESKSGPDGSEGQQTPNLKDLMQQLRQQGRAGAANQAAVRFGV